MWSCLAKAKERWLRTFLESSHGIPSHDTFSRVFTLIDAEQFQRSFRNRIAAVEERIKGETIALDVKQLRRPQHKAEGQKAIYILST